MGIGDVRYNRYDSMQWYWAFGGVLDIYGCLLTGGVCYGRRNRHDRHEDMETILRVEIQGISP